MGDYIRSRGNTPLDKTKQRKNNLPKKKNKERKKKIYIFHTAVSPFQVLVACHASCLVGTFLLSNGRLCFE